MESTPTPRSSVSPPTANDQAPKILDLPIGLDATGMRREFDSLGPRDAQRACGRANR